MAKVGSAAIPSSPQAAGARIKARQRKTVLRMPGVRRAFCASGSSKEFIEPEITWSHQPVNLREWTLECKVFLLREPLHGVADEPVHKAHLDEAGLQPARVNRGDEPRALPWAGMKDIFGVGTSLVSGPRRFLRWMKSACF